MGFGLGVGALEGQDEKALHGLMPQSGQGLGFRV